MNLSAFALVLFAACLDVDEVSHRGKSVGVVRGVMDLSGDSSIGLT